MQTTTNNTDNTQSLEIHYMNLDTNKKDTQIFFSWADFLTFDNTNEISVTKYTWIQKDGCEWGNEGMNSIAYLYEAAEELGLDMEVIVEPLKERIAEELTAAGINFDGLQDGTVLTIYRGIFVHEAYGAEQYDKMSLASPEVKAIVTKLVAERNPVEPTDPIDPNSQEGLALECEEALTNDEYIFLVCFSGGKDSIAMVLDLLAKGISRDRIILHHHEVDGGGANMFDWAVTTQYCRAFADALGLEILFSYREGGILREMYRGLEVEDEGLQDVLYQQTTGGEYFRLKSKQPKKGKGTVRGKFPAVSADPQTRRCSSAVKIDVLARVMTNHPQYKVGGKYIVCTGERKQESTKRAGYDSYAKHKSNSKKRRVIQWRCILDWTDEQVWGAMEFFKIQAHPCYELGWGRCSCQICIFSSPNVWASIGQISPLKLEGVFGVEVDLDHTLYNGTDILDKAALGTSFVDQDSIWVEQATVSFTKPIFVDQWVEPKGAYSEGSCGAS